MKEANNEDIQRSADEVGFMKCHCAHSGKTSETQTWNGCLFLLIPFSLA
jgi:hypothetical protein